MIALFASPVHFAHASDTHYQDYILGSRAVGLAGAYTAIASDPSATWYNPAGLPDVRRASVDISTNLYGFSSGESQLAASEQELGKSADISANDINIIPATLGVAKGLGKRRNDGVFDHAIAFSLLVPSLQVSSLVEETGGKCANDKGDSEFHVQRSINDRTLWTGLGYGWRVNNWLNLGTSAFYVLRSFERIDDSSSACITNSRDLQQARFNSNSTSLRFSNGNLVLQVGAKARVSDRFSLGVSVGSPSLRLNSEGKLSGVRTGTDSLPGAGCDTKNSKNMPFFCSPTSQATKSETRLPLLVRFGAAYVVPKRLTAALDFSFHGPVEYQLFATENEPDANQLPILSNVERKPVVNINIGLEYLLEEEISASVGAFTNFSSAPDIPNSPNSEMLPNIDLYGFSAAAGYFTEHSLLRIGFLYSFGFGHDVLPAEREPGTDLSFDPKYQRIDFSKNYLYLFVASTFRY